MESERLRITLDNPERIYFAGETIKGEIWLNLQKRTKIRAIKVQITGKGKCKWMEILRKSSNNNESTRSLFYSSKEIYAHSENPLSYFEPRGIELNAGEHTFEFTVPLDWNLPSSFKGSYGSIKYKMRILIQRPWTFDERHTIPLTVVKTMPLPVAYRTNPTSLEKQITKTISLFGTRPITMLALLPEDYAVRGEPLRICVTVINNSTTNVEKLRFTVLQYVTYYSHVPLRVQKIECIAIANKETGAVHKKSERSFAHELLMPAVAQPSDDQLSGVINIHYELRVEAVLRGFFKNLVLNLPFKVYSNDASPRSAAICPPPPTQAAICSDDDGSNPFETASAHANVHDIYPTFDASIGSPSHSSHYSECSSLNSTTSDSSAATLSPAVGGCSAMEYSYTTTTTTSGSQSSQYNSPTARASLRSSNSISTNVPYMPYSSSPLMAQSYPPPHLPPYPLAESPQYTLMAAAIVNQATTASTPSSTPTPTPPPVASGYSQLPSTSATSYLNPRQPAGAHELPPSYEELFGNASAPPDTPK